MAKPSGLVIRAQQQRKIRDGEVRKHTQRYMLDLVTCALGRMGFGEKRLAEFDRVLSDVAQEYAELILTDAADDPDLDYSKACIDRELQRYTGSRFVPYDERYRV